ncbi:MAX-binding protein [Mytilus galloprovincialis]|uniref:Max-binding protein MNT n=1 Tax=Mytilus galloprovincialis TaxID=29158 RepID=A0A8B6END1_MYTGA|nr:MAX-binding protein [Mytilus galloprovincialis]
MSLETLLEAAEYLEWRNKPKTRGDSTSEDPHGYSSRVGNDSDDSPESSNSGKYADGDEREKRRAGGAGTREVHNKLEKNRRAHLKECFDYLKKQIPTLEDKRTSNLGILRGSLRYIQALRRKEKEYEFEMQRLAKEKIFLQERLASLKGELSRLNIEVDLDHWKVDAEEQDSNSTSTATEQGSPICSEEDNEELPGRGPYKLYTSQLKRSPTKGTIHLTQPASTTISSDVVRVTNTIVPAHPKVATPSFVNCNKVSTTISPNPYIPLSHFPARTPVTQLLAHTLNQRQMLQRQQKAQLATSVTSSITRPVTNARPTFTFTPLNTHMSNPSAQLQAISKMANAGLSLPMTTFQVQPVGKGLPNTQHLLVTPNPAVTSMHQSHAVVTSFTPTVQTNPVTYSTGVATPMRTTVVPTAAVTSVQASHHAKNVTQMANVRPMFAPHLMAGHIPLNALLAQTIPRTSLPSGLSTVSSPSPVFTSTPNQGSSSLQLMSLAQMTPGTQLLSPMSPALQLGAAGLTQAQLSQMLLKQIPIFTPGLLQAGQVQSMIPSVVKPLVVVSVPNVVTTTNINTTTAITKPSSGS